MEQPAAAGCPTCGAALTGRFCAACGEETLSDRDYSVAHYIGHVFENLTDFDFRSPRTFGTLVARPGRLTRDFLDGRRRIYISPVQLFVVVNIAFALAGTSTFRTPLAVQEHDPPFPALKRSLVAGAMAERPVAREEFRRLFFAHLVFATHFLAFMLAWMLVTGLVTTWGLRLAGVRLTAADWDSVASALTLLGLVIYLVPALRQVFGGGRMAAVARAFAMAVLIYPIVLTYRFLLFFVTLWTMH